MTGLRPGKVVLSERVERTETTVDGVRLVTIRRVVDIVQPTEPERAVGYRSAPDHLRRRVHAPAVVAPAPVAVPSRWSRAVAWVRSLFRVADSPSTPSACSTCGAVDEEPCDAGLHG